MNTILHYITKHPRIIMSLFATVIIVTVYMFVLFQLDAMEKVFYRTTYVFTKVSSNNISQLVSAPQVSGLIKLNQYTAYAPYEYKQFENQDIYIITDEYLKLLYKNNMTKYKTAYTDNEILTKQINNIIDSFLTLEHVKTTYIIDKSGYVPFVGTNYRAVFRGNIELDKKSNILHMIFPEMSADFIEKNYLGDNVYYLKDLNIYYTCYPITIDNKMWAHLMIVYDNDYFKEYKNNYMKKATLLCLIIIVMFGLIIKGAQHRYE